MGGEDQVAMQQHGRADAGRRAMHSGHKHLARTGQRPNEMPHRAVADCRRVGEEITQVDAGGEAIAIVAEHYRPDGGVGVGSVELPCIPVTWLV